MAKTLSNGVIVSEDGDSDTTVYTAITTNWALLNQALGQRSPGGGSLQTINKTIAASNWASDSGGGYSYTLTWTDNFNAWKGIYNAYFSTGECVQCRINIAGTKAIKVFINDNTKALKITGVEVS